MLLQKEAEKYSKNSVFLQNLKCLQDQKREVKLNQELYHPLKVALVEVLPNTMLTREPLIEDVQAALVACNLIPHRSYCELYVGTKPGDETPYSINIPIKNRANPTGAVSARGEGTSQGGGLLCRDCYSANYGSREEEY